MQAHVAINTHTHTLKCHTNTHITLSGTRTHTFYGSALKARELPAVGDLWENRIPPVPLSSPLAPRERLCPTGATSIYSLIRCLIGACLLFSIWRFCFFLPLSFVVPCRRSFLCVWSQGTRFRAITLNRIKVSSDERVLCIWYLESRWWWDLIRFRFGLKGGQFRQIMLLLLPVRNLAIRSVTVCVCDGVRGQHISVSVFTLSHSFTSLLSVPLFCFWLAERLGADRLIEDRLKHGQTPIAVNLGFAPFPCKHKP